jgi:hypothetical protein
MNYIIVDGDRDNDGITVEITRSIRVGQTLRINPSEAFLGIESGIIVITHVGTREELIDSIIPDAIRESIQTEYEVMMDNLDDKYAEDRDTKERLDIEPWVAYQYTNGERYSSPLELFIQHTMEY